MNSNNKWLLGLACSVIATAAVTWLLVRPVPAQVDSKNGPPAQLDASAKGPSSQSAPAAKNEESVRVLVAIAKSLIPLRADARPSLLQRILDEKSFKLADGRKVEFVRVPMTSPEMIDGLLHGTTKAHIIVPSDDIYLDLLDREWTLRTGKSMTTERCTFLREPYVLAVRKKMAEALGWPKKEVGWKDVIDVARDGWTAAGHQEWGSLKMLLVNPNYSDTGVHGVLSMAHGILERPKTLTADDVKDPAFEAALKWIDKSVVWYPSSVDDLLRNEMLTVPSRCDMVFLAEHHMFALNERSAQRKAPPEWVAIYPKNALIVDGVTAALVNREWVTKDHEEAARKIFKEVLNEEAQKNVGASGYRPADATAKVGAPFTAEFGVNPILPATSVEMPPVEVVLDCLATWEKVWKPRTTESVSSGAVNEPRLSHKAGVSMQKISYITPTIQCVRKAKPSTVTIRDAQSRQVHGTGVIIDARGYAVTNSHVVAKAKKVAVNFIDQNDKIYEGDVIAVDTDQDLALIRLAYAGKMPTIEIGAESSGLEVGQPVIAIGNPLGYTGTVTVGILSALGRDVPLPWGVTLTKLIQTDAGINPGNSGGPLLDVDARLIGVVFAVREGAQSIAFAIPIERVQSFLKKAMPE